MVRRVLVASMWLLLVATWAINSAGGGDPVVLPEKADLALVVNLRVPTDLKWTKVVNILDKVKEQGASHVSVQASKEGEGVWAEVVVQPQTPPKRVAAVVGELLEGGIKKISIEVKK
jgi:hypothetical protein